MDTAPVHQRENGDSAGSVRAGIARRWRWPVWVLAVGGAIVTFWAFVCPAMLERQDQLTLIVTHVACMARTFGLQAGVACLVLAGLSRLAGVKRGAAALAVLALVWLTPEVWKQVRPVESGAANGRETLTVLSVNALYGRSSATAIEREAEACRADVVVFQEYTPKLEAELKAGMKSFPHRVEMARDDAFGQGVFSRRPFARAAEIYPSQPRWSIDPQISVWVEFDGGLVRVTDVHLIAPTNLGTLKEQRRQIGGLVEDVRTSMTVATTPNERIERIVVGDFNGTPEGHIVGALGGLMVDSWAASSRGRGGTWPVDPVLGKLGKIRLDNLLHTAGLTCIASGVGGETGSDHLPTWARYVRARDREPGAPVGGKRIGAK